MVSKVLKKEKGLTTKKEIIGKTIDFYTDIMNCK